MTTDEVRDDPVAESAGPRRSRARRGRPAWLQTLIAGPATILPLLPSFSCPVCVAAYAGLLSSFGLGFLLTDRVRRPLIVAFLIVSVVSVGWAATRYKKVGPFVLALLGSAAIVAGRLIWNMTPALYAGVVCLVAGTIWNLILKRPRRNLLSLAQGDLSAAGENYEENVAVSREIRKRYGETPETLRDLSVSLTNVGAMRVQRDIPSGMQYLTEALETAERLAKQFPSPDADALREKIANLIRANRDAGA